MTQWSYWHIGECIDRNILDNERAAYEQRIISTLSRHILDEYRSAGFDVKSIRRMMQFADLFLDEKIVVTLSRQLLRSHFVEVLPLKDDLQRECYITFASTEH